MRLFVFFDLPVKRKVDRKAYSQFRKFLLKDGYDMMQFSIYHRICSGEEIVSKHIARLVANKPAKGNVRYMHVTEKQFQNMKVLVGEKKRPERQDHARQLSLF